MVFTYFIRNNRNAPVFREFSNPLHKESEVAIGLVNSLSYHDDVHIKNYVETRLKIKWREIKKLSTARRPDARNCAAIYHTPHTSTKRYIRTVLRARLK